MQVHCRQFPGRGPEQTLAGRSSQCRLLTQLIASPSSAPGAALTRAMSDFTSWRLETWVSVLGSHGVVGPVRSAQERAPGIAHPAFHCALSTKSLSFLWALPMSQKLC